MATKLGLWQQSSRGKLYLVQGQTRLLQSKSRGKSSPLELGSNAKPR